MSDVTGPSDNRGTIARYIEALRRAGADPSAEDIADALWLLLQIDPRQGVSLELPPWREQEPQPPLATTTATSADQDKGSLQGEEVPESHRPAPDAQQSRPGLDLLPGAAGDGAGRSGALLKTPQATALPGTPEIARALRPFRRRVPSRTMQVIDEQATAQRTAEERLLSIVLRPVRTRWLAVDLVIDESASMAVWQRTVLAFRRLLVRLGAFRDVRVWGLNADSPGDLRLYAGLPSGKRVGPPHSLNELVDPSGRHLILLVSDCVSPGWHSGAVARAVAGWQDGPDVPALAGWGRTNPVALVQLLPQDLWHRTSLGREVRVRVRGPLPGVPNARLDPRLDDPMFDEDDEPPPGLAVPVVSLDPPLMRRWAQMVAGAAGITTTGYILNPTGRALPSVSPIRRFDASQLIQNFLDHASPEAQALAVLLAAVPVTISVINLVQQEMLPGSRQIHAAEVLLSGLLRQVTPPDAVEDPDEIAYEFVDGVRELLLEAAPLLHPSEVIERLSSFIADHLRGEEEMQSRVAGVRGPTVAGGGARRPFARISPALLRGLGLKVEVGPGEPGPPGARPLEEPSETPSSQEPEAATPSPAARRPRTARKATRRTSPGVKHRLIYDAQHTRKLPGRLVRSEGQPPTGDPAVDEAYHDLGICYDFFWEIFRRDSIDGAGGVLQATVHYEHRFNNAFWDGTRVVFGDGDDQLFNRFTVAIDVIASLVAEGMIKAETNLREFGQSGALANALADVFGQLVKQYIFHQTADQADWLVAAGLLTPRVRGVALRSMKAPGTAYDDPVLGKDPTVAHMHNYVRISEDKGGVHINSGIPSHAFYLTAIRMGGYAWEKAGRIWYETLRNARLRPNTSFRTFARLTIVKAGQLFGHDSLEQQVVREAWSSVGIDIAERQATRNHRAAQLRDQVTRRQQMYVEVRDGLSHRAVDHLMALLVRRQDERLQRLETQPSPDTVADIHDELQAEIGATQEVLQLFQSLIDQRRDPHLARQIDTAERVVADCYRTCATQVWGWSGIRSDDFYRGPPMVTIGSGPGVAQGGPASGLSAIFRLRDFWEDPFYVVTLPADYAGSVWLYCVLHREVAHAIMNDLRDDGAGPPLEQDIAARLRAGETLPQRAEVWQRWAPEIVADAFGVLLGGVGFGTLMASLLPVTTVREERVRRDEPFPDPYVRSVLIEAMLRRCEVHQFVEAADWMRQRRASHRVPEGAEAYLAQCDRVAELTLAAPLESLRGRTLRHVVSDLAEDAQRAELLAAYLHTGLQRPSPAHLTPRLLPVAAQIARMRMEQTDTLALGVLHTRAMEYLESIPRPQVS